MECHQYFIRLVHSEQDNVYYQTWGICCFCCLGGWKWDILANRIFWQTEYYCIGSAKAKVMRLSPQKIRSPDSECFVHNLHTILEKITHNTEPILNIILLKYISQSNLKYYNISESFLNIKCY